MKKIIIFVVLLVVVFLGVFYFQFQTYFINQEVSESIPEMAGDAEPMVIKQGNFVDSDFIHKGTGKAMVLEYPDGKKVLRFEDLDITNGPDLYIYLSDSVEPKGNIASLGDYYDLGLLKGNMGNQNYDIPAEAGDFKTVVIWCKKFGALFPYAVLN